MQINLIDQLNQVFFQENEDTNRSNESIEPMDLYFQENKYTKRSNGSSEPICLYFQETEDAN